MHVIGIFIQLCTPTCIAKIYPQYKKSLVDMHALTVIDSRKAWERGPLSEK